MQQLATGECTAVQAVGQREPGANPIQDHLRQPDLQWAGSVLLR
jgi:hypothetical protein